jgi:hypothetical protein
MPFGGQLSLDEDERPLRADVDFVGSDLILSTAAGLIGRWPLDSCRIQPDNGRFLISVDGETAWFVPDEPDVFISHVLEHWGTSTLTSAMKAVRAAAGPRPTLAMEAESADEADRPPSFADVLTGLDGKTKRLIATVVVGLVLVLLIANTIGGRPVSPLVLGTVATTTTVPAIPFVFQTGLDRVALMWNDAASDLGLDVFLLEVTTGNRLQTPLLDDLVLYGTENPGLRTVHSLMVSAGPALGDEGTAVLAVWGNLIAVVNPELDPEGRRAILERLGVDLDRPLTLGLDTETTESGARYWLRSGILNGRVHFGVEPNQ